MALTREECREEEETHKHTSGDAGRCCTWMNTHTCVQGRCQRTYGPCHRAQTLSVRSLIGSERTIWQRTVTPLIRGDTAALPGQPGGHYYHHPDHKFTFRVIVFPLIMCTRFGPQYLINDLYSFMFPLSSVEEEKGDQTQLNWHANHT